MCFLKISHHNINLTSSLEGGNIGAERSRDCPQSLNTNALYKVGGQ